ncbi:MAG TPA: DUF6807 family protein, partial [Chthoniobacteraceae bacterium]|nr:DUF6807 family protein [Chthoniobacteraceae bacterium]
MTNDEARPYPQIRELRHLGFGHSLVIRHYSLVIVAALLATIPATETFAEPKPVPRMQVVPQAHAQISFQRDGVEIARYHYGDDNSRPFIFPVIGPSGRSLTRMGHPHDPMTHSHHNSVWISHQFVNGVNFWEDRAGGPRIVQQRIERLEDGDSAAFIEVLNHWLDKDGKVQMQEHRRVTAQALENGEWLLLLDLQFEA